MVHTTVNQGDVDAVAHQVDLFFELFGQVVNATLQMATTQQASPKQPKDELRIWMNSGKDERVLRQVYGRMANGQHRNDLTLDRLQILLDALQVPVSSGVDFKQYQNRKPAIEIKVGKTTLYRQERDGIVTINEIGKEKSRVSDLVAVVGQRSAGQISSAIAQRDQKKQPVEIVQRFVRSLTQGGIQWLTTLIQQWQQQAIAQAALQAFQQGYEGTKENHYQIGGFSIEQQGKNQYVLSDASGTLMRFRESRSGIKVLSVNDRLTQLPVQTTLNQLSDLPPQGAHEAEYAFKVHETEQTVREFLKYMQTPIWDAERGRFRLELTEDDLVLIFSKFDHRGQVHGFPKDVKSSNSLVMTRLTWQDFEHFDELKRRLAQHREQQNGSILPIYQNGKNGKGAAKSPAIELD